MAWLLNSPARLTQCPKEFQDRINAMAGFNRYGQPNVLLTWQQNYKVWWSDGISGYKEFFDGMNQPCWAIRIWHAPEEYGTPEIYYAENLDYETGLCDLGEFPYKGKYEIFQTLLHKHFKDGKLVLETVPLDSDILDMAIPLIFKSLEANEITRKIAVRELEERKEKIKVNKIEDIIRDATPAYKDAVSFSRQGCRSSYIQQRAEAIEKSWKQNFGSLLKRRGQGISIH